MNDVCTYVNSKIKEFEAGLRIANIVSSIKNTPEDLVLVSPSRVFLLQASVSLVKKFIYLEKDSQFDTIQYELFIFNDLIVFCSKKVITSNVFNYENHYHLSEEPLAWITVVDDRTRMEIVLVTIYRFEKLFPTRYWNWSIHDEC